MTPRALCAAARQSPARAHAGRRARLLRVSYFLSLFSPETHAKYSASDRQVSGFRLRHRKAADKIGSGDVLVCYLTRLSRWVGLLDVVSESFESASPIYSDIDDPFVVRFRVEPSVWLAPQYGIPIHDDAVWNRLSFTREHARDGTKWTGAIRSSLARVRDDDAQLLVGLLTEQAQKLREYPLDLMEQRALQPHRVRRVGGEVSVSIPDDGVSSTKLQPVPEARESIKIQALLAQIGTRMGFRIWIPAADRAAVLSEAPAVAAAVVDALPLNYDTTTLRTIENIDVLWLKGRSMARAFEVEHTTAIYSGILRMADLLALQPNMDIRLHIAAPDERKQKVFDEIQRPVFSLLEGKALADRCTFLSYDSIRKLASAEHLDHMSASVLDEFEEDARP